VVTSRLAHVAIGQGEDVDESLRFYRELFGACEVARSDTTIFLSAGKKPGYDLALGPWPAGLHHFAFQVASHADLDEVAARLEPFDVQLEEIDVSEEHGVERGLRLVLPSGHLMELVVASETTVFKGTPAVDHRHFVGVGPVELEHVSLNFDDVEETATFLVDYLDFHNTEFSRRPEQPWFLAFLRCRDIHHDLGMFRNGPDERGPGLNHFAFAVPSVNELVRVGDIARVLGYWLECSPGRHLAGDNIFVYLRDPSGNRVEVSTALTKIDIAAPTRAFEAHDDSEWLGTFDAWREGIPEYARSSLPCWDARSGRVSGTASTR
jgi:catechol 2,3-dioxygenase